MIDPRLLAAARAAAEGADPAHDLLHVERVRATAAEIARAEGADVEVCETAALLHELFSYPKGHPESHRSGEVCAERAAALLRETGADAAFTERVAYAIRVHPFSAGIEPDTLEAKVLQDADRLDAIGAIGLARLFATTTAMRRPFYEPGDPFCERRTPDDRSYGLDHVYRKLLRIPQGLHTETARTLAAPRVVAMTAFLAQLRSEIRCDSRPGAA
jgi:uncharacterized protein